ncbi:MAG TPA: ATP-binding cassette domain-containing protein, partial [Woeseiaceae bacterium]|nr:ATP-binding cassette domain-containing protein [Woeseiaceae bacterium]
MTVRDLHNRFGAERVHEGLSLTVHRGEIFGIVGASGSGKSVLMRSILGLHQPDGGEIRVLGRDVRTLDAELSRRWGVVFQSGALISGLTVRENVELPLAVATAMLPRTRRELARLRLGMVGLDPDAGGKYPAELSGGMRRRAALARALALEPRILFLDEPTSGLDPVGASEFDELITGLRRRLDLTILMITHDLD